MKNTKSKDLTLLYIHMNAVQNRDMLAKTMTPAQIAEAQRLAAEWKPKESGKDQTKYGQRP